MSNPPECLALTEFETSLWTRISSLLEKSSAKEKCPEMNHFLDTSFGGEIHHQTAKKGLPHF
jgi:hypothetical protein